MKTLRRKFTIIELMDLEIAKNSVEGPVDIFVLSPEEFQEFRSTENGRANFKSIAGRLNDEIGGDWRYKGILIQVKGKIKS
jgi:hypothetical protein